MVEAAACSVSRMIALPGDHRPVVGLAQLGRRGDLERAHEVLHVEPVGAPGAGALLLLSQISSSGMSARRSTVDNTAAGVGRRRQGAAVVDHAPGAARVSFLVRDSPYVKSIVINRIIT